MNGETHFYKLLTAQLNKYGCVELDGIVKIQQNFTPASFDPENGFLRPPKVTYIPLHPSRSSKHSIGATIEALEDDDPHKLQILSYLKTIQQQWTEEGEIEVPGIGTLTQKESGLNLQLKEDNPSFFDVLPNLKVSILEKKTRISEPSSPATSSMIGKRIEGFEKESGVGSYILPLILLLAGMIAVVLVFKYFTRNTPTPKSLPVENEMLKRAQDDVAPFEDSGENQIFENKFISKYKNILSKEILEKGCEIVVGSFTTPTNANQFARTLDSEGYVTGIQQENDITRVVIVFDCASRDIVDYLVEIRIKLNEKAWLLKPLYDPFKDSLY